MKDEKYIKRIINYCNKITRYLKTAETFDDFTRNEEKVDAVLLNLEQIGETAQKISELYKMLYPKIEWNKIIGLRNLISHEYEGVDITLIYNVAVNNITKLLELLFNVKQ